MVNGKDTTVNINELWKRRLSRNRRGNSVRLNPDGVQIEVRETADGSLTSNANGELTEEMKAEYEANFGQETPV
jgi:hypothetical protein